jgi:hypothetical protein
MKIAMKIKNRLAWVEAGCSKELWQRAKTVDASGQQLTPVNFRSRSEIGGVP